MKFNLDHSAGIRIHAYDEASLTLAIPGSLPVPQTATPVADSVDLYQFEQSLVIGNQLLSDELPASYSELNEQHLESVLSQQPEVIILGTGNTLRFPEAHLLAIPAKHGIGMEVMDMAAACRTYNILAAEDRQVIAMLFMA